MFKKFIVASETTHIAYDVIKRLKALRNLGSEECLLIKCIDTGLFKSDMDESSYENLDEQKYILEEQGYRVETRVAFDNPVNEINRIALEEEISLVVAAAAEHSVSGEMVSGGFAHEVINRSQVPVLLVRVSDNSVETPNGVEPYDMTSHILFTTDFSANADAAFKCLKELVATGVKKVSLVHVQDIARINADIADRIYLGKFNYIDTQEEVSKLRTFAAERLRKYDKEDTQKLQSMKDQLQIIGDVEVDMELLYGSPSAQINKFVSDSKISLVVIGSQGLDSITGLFLGSVSNDVARHSTASVLVVPQIRR